MIVREAEVKAAELIEKAKNQVDRIKDETRLLKSQKESLAKRLKHLLSSHIELIKMLEMDDLEVVPSAQELHKEKKGKIKVDGIIQSPDSQGKREEAKMGNDIDRIIKNLEKQNNK